MSAAFLLGLAAGFGIAAPVGPIGILCIRRTLVGGQASGFLSGLGAATADACYAAVAAFGLTAVSNMLTGHAAVLRVIGGLFLVYLGYGIVTALPPADGASGRTGSLAADYVSTLALTITNPTTILSFAAVFAGLGLGRAGVIASPGALVAGTFLGSAAWWAILSTAARAVRGRLTAGGLRWVNRVSGAVIGGFGLAVLLSALR